MQEASSRGKVAELQQLLADLLRNLLQRERELEDLKSKGTGVAQVRRALVCCKISHGVSAAAFFNSPLLHHCDRRKSSRPA